MDNDQKGHMRRALEYIRHHALAATALVCSLLALAGASYADFTVPAGSVGARQIKNHVIEPVKLNRQLIGGYIRHWAEVDGQGNVFRSSGPVRVTHPSFPSGFTFRWGDPTPPRLRPRCSGIATVSGNAQGSATIATADAAGMVVNTYTIQWQPALQPVTVAVIC
jgi:hypothetical protein